MGARAGDRARDAGVELGVVQALAGVEPGGKECNYEHNLIHQLYELRIIILMTI